MSKRQSVKLPEKFLCRVCTKWKRKTQFSNKELGKFTFRNQNSATQVTPITAKLRCRGCTGEAAHELECLGPCAKTKLLNEFSKAARKSGGSNVFCELIYL
ncbi:hypothetical protein EV44_g3409 [Erysiphe necator]|uniref:Stc1 domain-containing protein n=1 Tax=Uncinula necator TaxID=52586 RepID=A0A0B1P410_UNCNE|nr:hypothetical protein EV44_g3409 [Erysiphe necator]